MVKAVVHQVRDYLRAKGLHPASDLTSRSVSQIVTGMLGVLAIKVHHPTYLTHHVAGLLIVLVGCCGGCGGVCGSQLNDEWNTIKVGWAKSNHVMVCDIGVTGIYMRLAHVIHRSLTSSQVGHGHSPSPD